MFSKEEKKIRAREASHRWRERNREKQRERARLHARLPGSRQKAKEWARRNQEKVREIKARCRLKRKEKSRAYLRKKLYGLDPAKYQQMYLSQGGKCQICKINSATDVDHCHKTGKIRGLLCSGCNRGLGYFKDSWSILLEASRYVAG